jgi:hypothetical protein
MAGKGDGEGEGNVLKLENQIYIIKYVILFTNIIEWRHVPVSLYSTADIRNPRRRSTRMHGFAISKTGTGEAVRIETLETLEKEMC